MCPALSDNFLTSSDIDVIVARRRAQSHTVPVVIAVA